MFFHLSGVAKSFPISPYEHNIFRMVHIILLFMYLFAFSDYIFWNYVSSH
jgi:hypothetical protein